MKILIARSGGLGDCLLTIAVIRTLHHSYPDAHITILGNKTMCDVAELAGYTQPVDYNDPLFASLFSPVSATISEPLAVYLSQFDCVYLYSAFSQPEVLVRRVRNAGASVCTVLDPRLDADSHQHIIMHLSGIFNDVAILKDNIPLDPCSIQPILSHLRSRKSDGIVIHPGSGGHLKTWPLERFMEIAEKLDKSVSFVIGPAEYERGIDRILTTNGYHVILPEALKELAHVIGSAQLFIGNDSGAGHLAGMIGIPSVVLFGPTHPNNWRPVGNNVHTIISPGEHMAHITTDDVFAVIDMLELSS